MMRVVSLTLVVWIGAVALAGEVVPKQDQSRLFERWQELSRARVKTGAKAFVQSLSEEELVLAVRQAHEHLVEEKSGSDSDSVVDTDWSRKASFYLRDFVRGYFKKSVDTEPAPFWEMATDKKLDTDFRMALVRLVGVARRKRWRPASQGSGDDFDILLGIMKDTNELFGLRREAEDCVEGLLGERYYAIRKGHTELSGLGLNYMLAVSSEAVPARTKEEIVLLAEKYNCFLRAVILLTNEKLSFYERLERSIALAEYKEKGLITEPVLIGEVEQAIGRISLSEQDFISALRQNYEEFVRMKSSAKEEPEHGWAAAAGYSPAAGYVQHYFRTDANRSPEPFLEMAADKSLDVDFRKALLDMLEDNDFYNLRPEHLEVFSGSLLGIANDACEEKHLRKEARDALRSNVGRLYVQIRNDEPALREAKHLSKGMAVPPEKISARNRVFLEALAQVYKKLDEAGD
ncbi:MAG TPA: hypothetical protein VMX13_06770 [Sedimentisphaerales bacterium]|nr:hypothetical protein [Sedimentisphaerales bacterium]